MREIALRGRWYQEDQAPIYAILEKPNLWEVIAPDRQGKKRSLESDFQEPVALVPDGRSTFRMLNPKTGESVRMTEEKAAELAPVGYCFYRPFPEGGKRLGRLLKFGLSGLRREALRIAGLGVLVGLLGAVFPFLSRLIFDQAIPEAEQSLLLQYCIGLTLAALAGFAFAVAQGVEAVRLVTKIDHVLQAAVWDRLLSLPLEFFGRYSTGDLAQRAGGINAIRRILSGVALSALMAGWSSIVYLALMLFYDAWLATQCLILILIGVGATAAANLLQLRFQRTELEKAGELNGLVQQLVGAINKLRNSCSESRAFKVWAEKFIEKRKFTCKVRQVQNLVQVFNSGFPLLCSMYIYWSLLGRSAAEGAGLLSTGRFIAFTAAFGAFLAAARALSEASLGLMETVPLYERLKPIFTTAPDQTKEKIRPEELSGRIEVFNLSFAYGPEEPLILRDISLHIEAGEFIAFAGPSGSGKSTLVRLLIGFEKTSEGSVLYDGKDLNRLNAEELRRQSGIVLQAAVPLPTDVFHNIVGASTGLTLGDAWAAARMAGLEEDIKALPMGMHTVVGEGGVTFSGGQRQRLSIAKALVHKPRIVFFDEATSALDNKTQSIVTKSLEQLKATRIVVAHRLSSIEKADRIYVMNEGRVVQSGLFQELLRQDGLFRQLAERQMA